MQAPTNSLGRAAITPQAGPASDCIASSRSGTSRRYRLRSPITRQARSLGVTDGAAALAGVRGKMDGGPLNLVEPTLAFSRQPGRDLFRTPIRVAPVQSRCRRSVCGELSGCSQDGDAPAAGFGVLSEFPSNPVRAQWSDH